jgi:peptidoglycan/xylan/chitin deacetylase (PgdA/CDA1 family)
MWVGQTTLSRSKAFLLSRLARRNAQVIWDRPVCSFTFDDVEASAIRTGLPILAEQGVQGTWYVAGSFVGNGLERADIETLTRAGQDIQCHTYSHYRLSNGSAAELREDAQANRRFMRDFVPAPGLEHFSYPFGQVNLAAKRALLKDYRTLRSVYPGVNARTVDLGLLRSNAIYAGNFDVMRVERLVQIAVRTGGWLIFYTHGVEAEPDAWGCRPEQLSATLRCCLDAGLEPLSVAQAYRRLTPADGVAGDAPR